MHHLKYYVIFMVGIFLSLGTGIMIGITLENKDVLDNQQSMLIKQIEESFVSIKDQSKKLKDENKSIMHELDEYKKLSDLLFAETIRNKLTGINLAVIGFDNGQDDRNWNDRYLNEVVDFIHSTGAHINADIRINYNSENSLESESQTAFTDNGSKDFEYEFIEDIIHTVLGGDTTELIEDLQNSGFINISADYSGEPSDALLLIPDCSIKGYKCRYDIMIVESALRANLPVVAVETLSFKKSSYIPDYIKYGISTVDHIDTIYGKLSLLSILLGNPGNYGEGEKAKGLLPETIFPDFMEVNKSK